MLPFHLIHQFIKMGYHTIFIQMLQKRCVTKHLFFRGFRTIFPCCTISGGLFFAPLLTHIL
uniref:Uncharacterized protein n=1 Tax=Arundo donax TaxID=35708 RepID=A0A0A9FQS1_ARUDO